MISLYGTKRIRSFYFFAVTSKDRLLLVRRGEYLGLPGGMASEFRGFDEVARDTLSPYCPHIMLGSKRLIAISDKYEWDGNPAILAVYICSSESAGDDPLNAAWYDLRTDDPAFDITVKILKEAMKEKGVALVA